VTFFLKFCTDHSSDHYIGTWTNKLRIRGPGDVAKSEDSIPDANILTVRLFTVFNVFARWHQRRGGKFDGKGSASGIESCKIVFLLESYGALLFTCFDNSAVGCTV